MNSSLQAQLKASAATLAIASSIIFVNMKPADQDTAAATGAHVQLASFFTNN